MSTTLEQQVALDEALVPSAQRLRIGRRNFRLPSDIQSKEPTLQVVYDVLRNSPFFKAFLVTAAILEIYMQEFWATAKLHQHSICFKKDTRKHEHYWYKEYYACATGEAAPKPKASARKKKGGSASSTTPPTPIATPTPTPTVVAAPRLSAAVKGKQPARATTPTKPTDVERTESEQLKIVLRRSRQKMHISQQRGSGTDEGTGSKPGVPDVPSDDSEEELSWNSSDVEDVDEQTKGRDESEGDKTDESDDDDDDQDEAEKVIDDDDNEEEVPKIDEQKTTESDKGDDEATKSNRESKDEETREQEKESFDPIPRTPKDNEDDDNNEEVQGLRIGEEERMQDKEEADELYRDVNINQGRGLQVSQETEDSHVILTPTQSDAQQESSSTSSFMTNLLNSLIDPGMESIFTTGSTTVTPIPLPQSIMTQSIISTFTTASQLPTPPTQIPSLDLQSLPTFASVFLFEDRVKFLEDKFSNIPGIVNQYMHQQIPEAVQEAVQTQTDRLQDSIQRENDEFLKTIDENIRKIIKEQVLVEAYDADKTILDTYGESAILKQRREDDDQEGSFAGSDPGSKIQREGGEHASASTPSEPATRSVARSTTGTQSQQLSASESAFAEERPRRPPTPDRDWNKSLPATQGNAQSWISALAMQTDAHSSFNELLDTLIDFSNFIMNRLGIDTLTPKLLAGPTYELMRGSCNSLRELEYHLEEPLPLIPDNQGRRVIPFAHFINNDLEYLRGVNQESALDVYSKRRIIVVTELKIVEWHNYKHLDWILKRLNLTNPDTYRSDLKRREAYTAHSNPRGFIYQNKDKKNRLMRIDELYKFSDGTLEDVRNALDDRLKGIRMQYLPTTIWRKWDKDRAAAIIQAIDKMLKTRRIMRSLERFVGGRQYEGDFQMLQRTI
nr:hypothetical protein [Tanacetum cinerariifolium]